MTMTGINTGVKKGAELLIFIAILAFGKTASSQCNSVLSANQQPQGCGEWVSFFVNTTPPTDSIVFDFGDGNTFWTNGISAANFYTAGYYYVEATSYHTNGCVSTSFVGLTIGGIEVVTGDDTVACQTDLQLYAYTSGGSGNYIYSWSPAAGLNDSTLQSPTVTAIVTDLDYTVTVTDLLNGCQASSTINVTHNVALIDTLSLCNGSAVIDLGPGAVSYEWLSYTDTAGNNWPLPYSNTTQLITVDEPGTYYMYAVFPECGALTGYVVVEPCAQTCSNAFTYNVLNGPCSAEAFLFFGTATAQVYDWHWDFGDGVTSTSQFPNHTFPQGSFIVTLTTTDINGCTASSYQWITTNGGFTVAAINDSTFCQATGHLGGTVSGGSSQYTYQWTPATGLSDPTQLAPQVSAVDNQMYTLIVTDQQTGCTAIDSTWITVQAPVFGTYDLCNGPVTIDLGPGANAYFWQYFTDTSGNTINLSYPTSQQAIVVDEPGEYLMYAEFPDCGALTSLVTVEACSGGCNSFFTFNQPSGCGGWADFFAGTSSPTDSIVFIFGDGNQFTTNGISAQNYYLPGVYTVTMLAYHTNGCFSQSYQILTIGGGLSVNIWPSGPSVACGGDINLSASVANGSGNYFYQWFANGTLSNPSSPTPVLSEITVPTQVTLYLTDGTTGCQVADTVMFYPNFPSSETFTLCNDSVLLDASPYSMSYSWWHEDLSGNVTPFTNNTSLQWGTQVGTYFCSTYTSGCAQVLHEYVILPCNGGCTSFFSHNMIPNGCGAMVDIVPGYTPDIDSIVYYLGDGTTEVSYGNLIQHYYPSGTYQVQMVGYHIDGCISQSVQTIYITTGLDVEIINDSVACGGDIFLAAFVNGGSGAYMYQWFADGLPFAGSTSQSPVLPAISQSVEVSVFVSDSTGTCTASDTTVIFPNLPVNETYELCSGTVWLQVPPYSQTYSWSFEDPQGNTSSLVGNENFYGANNLGTYTCLTYSQACQTVIHTFEVVDCSTGCFAQISSTLTYDGCGAWLDFVLNATPTIDSVIWNLGNGQTLIDQGQGPVVYYGSGSYIASADVFFTNGCTYTTSYGITLLTEVITNIWEDTIACNGGLPLGVDVTGGGGQYEFQWSPANMMNDPSAQYPYMTVTQSTLVTVEVVDTYTGCTVYDSVMVYANQPVNEVVELCQGSAALELDPGSLIYQWTYTDLNGNTTQLPNTTNAITVFNLGTYACFTYYSGCNTITHLFTVVDCGNANDDVWPGDANSDNIVTAADALWIGLGYGQNGPVRTGATLNWVGQPASDWLFNFAANNVNLKHADCDGNGIINFNDTLAISLNYGLTHSKTEMDLAGGEPELWVEAIPDTAGLDQAIDIYVHLAKFNNVVDSIHGLSFTLAWDEWLTQISDVSVDFDNSIFGTPGTDLLTFQKAFLTDGRIDIATSRLNGINIDGYGEVVHMRIVTIDNLSGMEYLPFWLENVTAITSSEDPVPLMLGADTVVLDPNFTTIIDPDPQFTLQMFPNPTKGEVTIANAEDVTSIEVIDGLGRVVARTTNNGSDVVRMNLHGLASGLYRVRAFGKNTLIHSGLKISQ